MAELSTQLGCRACEFETARHGTHALARHELADHIERLHPHLYQDSVSRAGRPVGGTPVLSHFVSASCRGERCTMCGHDATHKVGEEILHDDPRALPPHQHNLTAYVCCYDFSRIMAKACGG